MANSKYLEKDMELNRLRSSIHFLLQDKQRLESKLIGVQVLTDQLDRKEEECRILKSRIEQLEVLLSRAENRIVQLTQQSGKGFFTKGVVTPGVSKKVLESLTRENTKLKLALEHVLNKTPQGIDLAVENNDLHDLVVALKEELQQTRKEAEELRSALKAVESDNTMELQEQIARLTAELTNTERSLKAKQVFCERIVNENERLKSSMEAVKSERITQLAILKNLANDYPVIKEVLEGTWSGPEDIVDGGNKAELEKLSKKVEELQKELKESEKARVSLQDEVDKLKEANGMLLEELHQHESQTKAAMDSFIDQNEKLKEEMREIGASFEEANMVKGLMEEQCKAFENDFKAERKEKEKLTNDMKALLKQHQERLQENNQLKAEMERIKSYIKVEYEKRGYQPQPAPRFKSATSPQQYNPRQAPSGKSPSPPPNEPWKASPTTTGYKPPHFNFQQQGVVCSDGPSDRPAVGRLQCPICHRSLPYDQMEDHINDCDRS